MRVRCCTVQHCPARSGMYQFLRSRLRAAIGNKRQHTCVSMNYSVQNDNPCWSSASCPWFLSAVLPLSSARGHQQPLLRFSSLPFVQLCHCDRTSSLNRCPSTLRQKHRANDGGNLQHESIGSVEVFVANCCSSFSILLLLSTAILEIKKRNNCKPWLPQIKSDKW